MRAPAKPVIAVLFGVFMAISCGISGGTKDPARPVRIALIDVPLAYLPAILADALGYYRQEGLAHRVPLYPTRE
jgi:ABC-type nitrate/sulfonate/bicarbonate transport system substrate-binding protein